MISIPFVAYESELARLERTIKRLWILCIILVVVLVASNSLWIWHESQFEDVATTIEAQQDGSGTNIVGGGDIEYGTESKDNN